MKNFLKTFIGIVVVFTMWLIMDINVYAAPGSAIESGVFADDINLSGMTTAQATDAIESRVNTRREAVITLTDGVDYSISFSAADINYKWDNKDIVSQAALLGKSGNVVKRYKDLKDLENSKKVYDIQYSIDGSLLLAYITQAAEEYNREAVNATISREEGAFTIVDGESGRELDENASYDSVSEFLVSEWDGADVTLNLVTQIVTPAGTYEDLSRVTDVLGTYTTSYSTSGSSRCANIANACSFINGITLYPGEEFSTLDTITPFSESNGYYLAGSYLNGQVVESLGGGICQVSTTLYNAVLLAELDVTERHNHSMIISYVKPSMDAAIAESSGKNFRFVNSTDYPIYIEGYTENKKITFVIYGVEYRESTHEVTYESETLEVNKPETDAIYTDASKPAGYSSGIQSAHIGYKARLWKNTYEKGELVSREEINSSTYNKSPRSVTIGVATDNMGVYNMLMEAASSGSADTAAAAASQAAAILASAPEQQPEQQPEQWQEVQEAEEAQ